MLEISKKFTGREGRKVNILQILHANHMQFDVPKCNKARHYVTYEDDKQMHGE